MLYIRCSKDNFYWTWRLCTFSPSRPVIANGIDKHPAVFTEVGTRDGSREFLRRFVLTFSVLVPSEKVSVAADCHKGVELLVEGNLVKTVNICRLAVRLLVSVAFESKVLGMSKVLFCDVVVADPTPAFN